jgi:hypothetical protein
MEPRNLTASLALAGILALAGCAATEATTTAKPAGFLGDYSQLVPGEGNEAQLVYVASDVDFSKYDSVILESVTFWVAKESEADVLDLETRQMVTDRLYRALHDRLSKDFKLVSKPSPSAIRIRAAITGAKDARVVLNAITSVVPQLRLLSQLGDLDNDTALLVGKASVECEFLDSATNERIAAGVDERMGNKTLKTAFTTWGDVDASFEFWADRVAQRILRLKAGDRTPVEG